MYLISAESFFLYIIISYMQQNVSKDAIFRENKKSTFGKSGWIMERAIDTISSINQQVSK